MFLYGSQNGEKEKSDKLTVSPEYSVSNTLMRFVSLTTWSDSVSAGVPSSFGGGLPPLPYGPASSASRAHTASSVVFSAAKSQPPMALGREERGEGGGRPFAVNLYDRKCGREDNRRINVSGGKKGMTNENYG